MALSELTQIKDIVSNIEELMLPQSRPQVEILTVDNVANVVNVGDQLRNGQLLGVVGETAGGAAVTGNTLWAEISSIANASFAERMAIQACTTSGFGLLSSSQLIMFIIESQTLQINMNGGATSAKLHFYFLPSTYLIQT